ncbi:hypothetical protein C7A11_23480 [Pseudomonas simiae]|jgi:hypothetical protein|uniref:hypothetical protein n=1 Tax=Pseudomonas simiae TaxID=321846 RepID=UPI000D040586|nr:hypothetical protein [Pseudomonas simiae]PRW85479.1 hypothetical protein C7A11_23480 [Pseudomonas simiae]
MKDIYLLVEHGRDQGEVYILGWFDDKESARDVAEAKEWQAYRAALSADASWSMHAPVPPDQTKYRRFWVQEISKFTADPAPLASATH